MAGYGQRCPENLGSIRWRTPGGVLSGEAFQRRLDFGTIHLRIIYLVLVMPSQSRFPSLPPIQLRNIIDAPFFKPGLIPQRNKKLSFRVMLLNSHHRRIRKVIITVMGCNYNVDDRNVLNLARLSCVSLWTME